MMEGKRDKRRIKQTVEEGQIKTTNKKSQVERRGNKDNRRANEQ